MKFKNLLSASILACVIAIAVVGYRADAAPVLSNADDPTAPLPFQPASVSNPTSISNILAGAGQGVAQVANDGYNVFKNMSLTNPITAGVVLLKNGSKPGFGIVAGSVNTNSLVNVGFGVFAIQTEKKTTVGGITTSKSTWGFYDATINLSVSKIETIPILNIPIELKIESGPAVRLSSGGNTLMEQSAVLGDITLEPIKGWPLTFGGGIINAAGSDLEPTMPFAHINFTHKF